MTFLLDGNLLVALVVEEHVHHDVATSWFGDTRPAFATCPITQGTLLRLLIREGVSAADAKTVLGQLTSHPDHEFWPDDIDYADVGLERVVGHRQVTDAYLAQLARSHAGRLATLDRGLGGAHPDVVEPIGRGDEPG